MGLSDAIVDSLDPQTATANLLPLVAPFDGLVVGQDIARGERIATEDNRFEIADVTHMLLRLDVREEDGEALRLGQQVVFATGNIQVTTSISWISTAVDPKTRTIEVRCDVTNPITRDEHGEPTGQFLLQGQHVRHRPRAGGRAARGDRGADQGGAIVRQSRTLCSSAPTPRVSKPGRSTSESRPTA